ncbi:MAG: OmpA family protein, partial [Cyclobacteriaceae bacterium]|nr:OmpA family protein [Cyclobacteriaceae bacterium]
TMFLYKVVNNGDIYVTNRIQDTLWTDAKPISVNINSEGFKESSVSISPDGKTLYFSSNRPGGLGGTDIFYSTVNDKGEWQRARNLSDVINTEFNEDGPFIDYDGKTLYFSSEGHKGMGAYDIFKTQYDSTTQTWSPPINIGYPINTPDDDIYFVSTKGGKNAYYASVREDGYGFTDLYRITFLDEDPDPEPEKESDPVVEDPVVEDPIVEDPIEDPVKEVSKQPVTVKLKVVDGTSGNALDATVSFKSIAKNTEADVSKTGVGEYSFVLKTEAADNYRLSVEAPGFVYETMDISVPAMASEPKELNRTVRLNKPVVNTRKVLRNIYFDFNKATFKEASNDELNRLYKMMSENNSIRIEISGHTDKIGNAAYNKALSQKRADAVRGFLVSKGIDAQRVVSIGYGEEQPLASNDDEKEGRELNRRVEFKVIN